MKVRVITDVTEAGQVVHAEGSTPDLNKADAERLIELGSAEAMGKAGKGTGKTTEPADDGHPVAGDGSENPPETAE